MRSATLLAVAGLVIVVALSHPPQPVHARVDGLGLTYVWVLFQETKGNYQRYNGTSEGSLQMWEARCTEVKPETLDCGGATLNVILNATVANSRTTPALDVVIEIVFGNHTLLSEPLDVPAQTSMGILQRLPVNGLVVPTLASINVDIKSARFVETTTSATTMISPATAASVSTISRFTGVSETTTAFTNVLQVSYSPVIAAAIVTAGAIVGLSILLVKRRRSVAPDRMLRDDLRYVAYTAKLEELKARREISEETYQKLKAEYWEKFKRES